MATEKLQLGDVVQLNSGGIPMTVATIDNGWVQCVYYIDGEVNTSPSIPEYTLTQI